jgi:hypothetical protein
MAQHLTTISEQNVTYFTTGLAITSLVLIASLAWNSAFQALFDKLIPSQKWEVIGSFLYAATLTAIIYYVIKAYLHFVPEAGKKVGQKVSSPSL